MLSALPFNEIWAVDFEFNGEPGNRPNPVCMAARELRSRRRLRLWADELGPEPPFSTGSNSLIVAGSLETAFGWELHVAEAPNARSLRNFMMQGCGADMLRAACVLGTENAIEVSAPVHDAVLITAPIDHIDADVAAMKAHMIEASRGVLKEFQIGVDAKTFRFPDRYSDGERSAYMWETVTAVVTQAEARRA